MNHEGDLTPPPLDPASPAPAQPPTQTLPTWWARYRRFLIPAAALAVVGTAAAAALVLALRPGASIEKMVPATVDVYAVANLDPSMSQKLNLLGAVHRFPDTSTDQKLGAQLDKALKGSGISFTGDLQPWIGSEVGVALRVPASGTDAPAAIFAVSRDDAKARAMLAKLRVGAQGQKFHWQDTAYGGITITVGSAVAGAATSSASPKAGAYAIVDHVVVIATSDALIREIIDADQGRAARLVESAGYKLTLAKLPADRLAVVYVNGPSIVAHLKQQLTTPLAASLAGLKSLGDLQAFQGAALALSARPDGLVADTVVRLDAGKLSPSSRDALAQAGHPNAVIGWIPRSSDGFYAFASLNRTIQSLLAQSATDASIQKATDAIGLTGAHGVLPHLTGDFAFEAEVDRSFFPAGAVILGSDDASSMRSFLAGILALAGEPQGSQATPRVITYRGATITSVAIPGISLQDHFLPSYAVVDGMGILASTPAELETIIDAHIDNTAITGDATYAAAGRASLANPSAVFYLDLGKIVMTIQAAPAGSALQSLHLEAGNNLTPFKAIIVSSAGGPDALLERFVVFIE